MNDAGLSAVMKMVVGWLKLTSGGTSYGFALTCVTD